VSGVVVQVGEQLEQGVAELHRGGLDLDHAIVRVQVLATPLR